MNKETFARNILTLRKARNWTQQKLAEEADVSYHTIFRAEAGTMPRIQNLQKIAKALGVSESTLLTGEQIGRKSDLIAALISILPTLEDDELRGLLSLAQASPSSRSSAKRTAR